EWSPDGSSIAFVSSRDGNREIYLVRPDGSGLERLTNDPANDDIPKWSPDGKRIAFQAVRGSMLESRNYDIEVMRVADRARTRLSDNNYYDGMTAWSSDGALMA